VNIDQRIEALVQSVEPMAETQRDSEQRADKRAEETNTRVARLEESMAKLADGMSLLTRIVLGHHERIEKLEGGQPQQ
jgi:hypothetical protein